MKTQINLSALATVLGLMLGLGMLVGCSGKGNRFVAKGRVSGAEGQTLYLEEVGTGNVLSLDSVLLGSDGKFRFEREGMSYPMFYRLRLGDQSIPFAADSATTLSLTTTATNFFTGYQLTEADPYNYQIREVALLRHHTDGRIDSVLALYASGGIELQEARDAVSELSVEFKKMLAQRFIYADPKSPTAYFALFQRKGDATYFSADDEGDERAFAAVATAYDIYHSAAPYTPFLKDMALRAIARGRARRSWERAAAQGNQNIKIITFPEINLSDSKGHKQSLTELASKGPVLLSFTAYQAQWSPMLVSTLRSIQEKRPDMQIYEVSVDGDSYYWLNATQTLPWVCVNDPEGTSLVDYNVRSIPAFYLIKNGELQRLESPEQAL